MTVYINGERCLSGRVTGGNFGRNDVLIEDGFIEFRRENTSGPIHKVGTQVDIRVLDDLSGRTDDYRVQVQDCSNYASLSMGWTNFTFRGVILVTCEEKAELYTRDQVLAIFAAIGSKVADKANHAKRVADMQNDDLRRALLETEGNTLESVQMAIYEIVNKLGDGTNPETI